jgi:hypothetical protein
MPKREKQIYKETYKKNQAEVDPDIVDALKSFGITEGYVSSVEVVERDGKRFTVNTVRLYTPNEWYSHEW